MLVFQTAPGLVERPSVEVQENVVKMRGVLFLNERGEKQPLTSFAQLKDGTKLYVKNPVSGKEEEIIVRSLQQNPDWGKKSPGTFIMPIDDKVGGIGATTCTVIVSDNDPYPIYIERKATATEQQALSKRKSELLAMGGATDKIN